MLYYVQKGDTLSRIAEKFETTINEILKYNLICDPNLIFVGQPLIIPQTHIELPKAGAGPCYVVKYGDTLSCIAEQTGIGVETLAKINQIQNLNLIYVGDELLVIEPTTDDPEQLKSIWENTPGEDCEVFGFTEYGTYYLGSFEWVAFGRRAIPYLLQLLNHPCETVRLYTILSLGRLGLNHEVTKALTNIMTDSIVAKYARLAYRRIELVSQGKKRIHVLLNEEKLLDQLSLDSNFTTLPEGSEIVVLTWFIPSPTGEEGPRGGIQIYEQVQVVRTGQTGFLARKGLDQITFI